MSAAPVPPDRISVLSFMASLCVGAGEMRAAEGYLLELLSRLAFAHGVEQVLATA